MQLSDAARMLLIGLWTEADDQGVFEWKPLTLKARLRPANDGSVDPLLDEMQQHELIRRIEVDEKSYGLVRNFRKFQRPQKPNAIHPLPDEHRDYVAIDYGEPDARAEFRKSLCEAQNNNCFYCGTAITHYSKKFNTLDVDHKIPISRGGTDDQENLVASCKNCNRAKCDMTHDEFFALRKSQIDHAKSSSIGATTIVALQMEDVGCRMDDGIDTDATRKDDLADCLIEAAGASIDPTRYGLQDLSRPFAWLADGCDLDLDILPAVRRVAARASPMAIKGWNYFDGPVADAKANRTKPMPEGRANAGNHKSTDARARENHFAGIAAAVAEARG